MGRLVAAIGDVGRSVGYITRFGKRSFSRQRYDEIELYLAERETERLRDLVTG
jgi:hypothetical protein